MLSLRTDWLRASGGLEEILHVGLSRGYLKGQEAESFYINQGQISRLLQKPHSILLCSLHSPAQAKVYLKYRLQSGPSQFRHSVFPAASHMKTRAKQVRINT